MGKHTVNTGLVESYSGNLGRSGCVEGRVGQGTPVPKTSVPFLDLPNWVEGKEVRDLK